MEQIKHIYSMIISFRDKLVYQERQKDHVEKTKPNYRLQIPNTKGFKNVESRRMSKNKQGKRLLPPHPPEKKRKIKQKKGYISDNEKICYLRKYFITEQQKERKRKKLGKRIL